MKKFSITIGSLAMMIAACSAGKAPAEYSVKAILSPDLDGTTAYITDFDNGNKIDSCIVSGHEASFSGKIEQPFIANLIVNGQRQGVFIMEPGVITLAEKTAHGTPLNERMDSLDKDLSALQLKYESASSPEQREEIMKQYDAMIDAMMERNIDNPIGYYFFLQKGYEMTLAELEAAVAATPSLAEYKRVSKLIEAARKKEMTSVGCKMVDFEINSPDGAHKLSDYVGHGKYVLVDFWASWCGPCRKEIKTIKRILADSDPEKFEVLGVAVWDDPENTKRAIDQLQIPWSQIIDAQSIPTDLYGISGIPCIILFSPDGTILVRDKQGAELEEAVKEAMNK